ncbi:MAG: CheR family methyltransferase [Desulfatiglandaceae bacterium]
MTQKTLESFLENELGLSMEAIGRDTMARAIHAHKRECGIAEVHDYFKHLLSSAPARDQLIARVVVPETWFFRNRKSFDFMTQYVKTKWQPIHNGKDRALRILSVPCSSGEEPYSVAMALIDAKIPVERFRIDGSDINKDLLRKAESAVYGQDSFRGQDLSFRDRYFEPKEEGYALGSRVKRTVRFIKGNILDDGFLAEESSYDIVFCRNLLIYLNTGGKKGVFSVLDRLLKQNGLLFLGHAEREIALKNGFTSIGLPGVFACQRNRPNAESIQPEPSIKPAVALQRIFQNTAEPVKAVPGSQPAYPTPRAETTSKPDHRNEVQEEESTLFDRIQKLADEGSLPSACKLCRDFLKKNPAHIQANFLMGLIHEALGENDRAEALFNKTLYLDPSHHHAMAHLAFIVEQQGDKDKASHLRKRALRVYRDQEAEVTR